jgi:hypothetical protein
VTRAHEFIGASSSGAIGGGLHPGAVAIALLMQAADCAEFVRRTGKLPALFRACPEWLPLVDVLPPLLAARVNMLEASGLDDRLPDPAVTADGDPKPPPEVLH